MSADYVFPAVWVRAEKYCENTGEPMDAVKQRILSGAWAAGKHYKRLSPRVLMINVAEVTKWMDRQASVEALCPSGLKYAGAHAATR